MVCAKGADRRPIASSVALLIVAIIERMVRRQVRMGSTALARDYAATSYA
jgi:hypothetical protein